MTKVTTSKERVVRICFKNKICLNLVKHFYMIVSIKNYSFGQIEFMLIYLHFQSKPFMNLQIFATVDSLMNDINLIDSCQAHLHMQYSNKPLNTITY